MLPRMSGGQSFVHEQRKGWVLLSRPIWVAHIAHSARIAAASSRRPAMCLPSTVRVLSGYHRARKRREQRSSVGSILSMLRWPVSLSLRGPLPPIRQGGWASQSRSSTVTSWFCFVNALTNDDVTNVAKSTPAPGALTMSTMQLGPYLNLQGRARNAMEFYQKVLGGRLELQTIDAQGVAKAAGPGQSIMYARLEAEGALYFR